MPKSAAVEAVAGARERALAALELARVPHVQGYHLEAEAELDRALQELGGADEQLARELEATWVALRASPCRCASGRSSAARPTRPFGHVASSATA